MLEFVIEAGSHPHENYRHITINWLQWTTHNCISRINIDLPIKEVEATMMRHADEMDNLDFIRALQMVRHWKRSHPERPRLEDETLYTKDSHTETA